MPTTLGVEWALDWMARAARAIDAHPVELGELDRAIGAGGPGETLQRGFTAVPARLAGAAPASPAEVLKLVAATLISTVGGAAGPLYGTAFLRAATATAADAAADSGGALDAAAVAGLLEAALGGIVARGKASEGEATMVDAWAPAARAARAAAEAGAAPARALRAAADAAAAGAEATIPLQATKGRASYLGERSIGHLDPGARSSALLLEAAADAATAAPDGPSA